MRIYRNVDYQPSIVFLRGLAATLVLFAHYRTIDGYGAGNSWMSIGAIGVDIFFIISGYLMCMLLGRRTDFSPKERVYFVLSRVIRIYPVMLAAMVLYLFVRGFYSGGENFYLSALLIPSVNEYYGGAPVFFLEPQWSLGFEIAFYIVVGAFASRGWVFVILIVFGGVSVFYRGGFYFSPIVFEFLFGFLLYYFVRSGVGMRVPKYLIIIALFLGLYFVYQKRVLAGDIYSIERVLLWGGWALLFSFFVISFYPGWGYFQARCFTVLGEVSFSVYLIHMTVLIVASNYIPAGIVGLLIIFSITILSSYIFYRLVEKPIHAFSRRIKQLG